jgi:hypothetical protein
MNKIASCWKALRTSTDLLIRLPVLIACFVALSGYLLVTGNVAVLNNHDFQV